MATYQYVYTMKGLSKADPGGKEVVKDVWLSSCLMLDTVTGTAPGDDVGVFRY